MNTPTLDDSVVDDDKAAPQTREAGEAAADATPAHDPVNRDTPEPESIGDAAPTDEVVQMQTPAGVLTLSPTQTHLTDPQKSALVAIGIDIKADPGVEPHVRPFMHMCQVKGLDPFQREAYLIGRGKGKGRKWTMQTGIDGYRKIAGSTGRFRRVLATYWTGKDDDDANYVLNPQTGVMQRKWYDFWPDSKGEPGAAKVLIEHYDERGDVIVTEGVANWSMFAPYSAAWEGGGETRRKVRGPDGKDVMELGDMWVKGGPHMLAKTAEALGHRKAFPSRFGGIYTHEEMHRADALEKQRVVAVAADARVVAYNARRAEQSAAGPDVAPPTSDDPTPVGETVADVVSDLAVKSGQTVPDEDRAQWFRDEIAEQATILGTKPSALVRRIVAATKTNYEDFTVDTLAKAAGQMRETVVATLRSAGRDSDAAAYEQVRPGTAAPVDVLFGRVGDETADGPVETDDGTNPETPHPYIDDGGACGVCGRFGDETDIHPS